MRTLTLGTFDLLHTGHRHLFARAAEYGELVVGVNSDAFVSAYKGKPPVEPEGVRLAKVAAVEGVARVELNDGPGVDLIEDVKPELLVVGSDWSDRDYLGQIACSREQLETLGCDLLFVARIPGYSTTALRSQTFTAVIVTHANPEGAVRMVRCLLAQTRPPDEILVVETETLPDDLARLAEGYDVTVYSVDEVGDWGHAKRAVGLAAASSAWVGFFNDDDDYQADYLEKMLTRAAAGDVDVVYCAWNENPGCDFAIYQSTAGNFIVRRDLAQQVGWTGRRYEADGDFIEALKAADARTVKIDEQLYTHNAYEAAV